MPMAAFSGRIFAMIDAAGEIAELRARLAEREAELATARAELTGARILIEQYKAQLAKLRRMQFGRSSEALDERIEQLELSIAELEATDAQSPPASPLPPTPKSKPARRPLPMSLPREVHVHAPLPSESPCPTRPRNHWPHSFHGLECLCNAVAAPQR